MSEIEKIYYNMEKLSEDWGDMPETEKAYEAMEAALGEKNLIKYEDEICDYGAANEKQGFIKGFQYAVSLLTCGRRITQEVY